MVFPKPHKYKQMSKLGLCGTMTFPLTVEGHILAESIRARLNLRSCAQSVVFEMLSNVSYHLAQLGPTLCSQFNVYITQTQGLQQKSSFLKIFIVTITMFTSSRRNSFFEQ